MIKILAVLTALATLAGAGDKVGEFAIPPVTPLSPPQLTVMRRLAAADAEAKALAAEARQAARPWLDAKPQPLEVIHYEGLVNTDPRRIASVKNLRDMTGTARLVRYWQVAGDKRAATALKRFILAWTDTYELTGNDVNENKFYPLLVACYSLRPTFPEVERQKLDEWVKGLGKLHQRALQTRRHLTNRYTKSVRLLAICGMILERPEWLKTAHQAIKRFVSESLFADGASADLKRRDTLTYHSSALKPILELAMLAGERGRELYAWESPKTRGSLKKSVDYVVPYAMGKKTRREWTRSKVDLDRRRAAAGLDYYRAGRTYDPQNALELMERASYFDPDLMSVVQRLSGSQAKHYPTWQTLVNAACRAAKE